MSSAGFYIEPNILRQLMWNRLKKSEQTFRSPQDIESPELAILQIPRWCGQGGTLFQCDDCPQVCLSFFSHLLADSSCYLGILQEVLGQKCEQVKFSLILKTRKVQQNQRILFREYIKKVKADDYKCLVCDPAPLLQHRALFWSIIHEATA